VESMSNLPYYLRKARFGYRMGNNVLEDGLITALSDPFSGKHMGITAENIAEKFRISREEQDKYALLSQIRALNAINKNLFKEEIIPIKIDINENKNFIFEKDEHPRPDTTLEKLAKLKPAFKENGTVTAGNSSGINDAAAALLVMKMEKAKKLGFKPKVKLVDFSVAGVQPEIMGTGPIPAIKKLIKKTSLSLDEIGIIELNEAFAVQAIVCIRELGLDIEKVNINGGAIAFGHPIGATGAILTVKIINEMVRERIKYGIVSMCIGGGQGIAVLLELID
jgi:acetyl-CoA C-acetyltransferase